MESEANLKILLPVFEIKKEWGRQAESPGSWEEEEEGSGEEKRNQPFKFKYTGPRAAGWEWKGGGSSEKQKTHVRESVLRLWADIQERDR